MSKSKTKPKAKAKAKIQTHNSKMPLTFSAFCPTCRGSGEVLKPNLKAMRAKREKLGLSVRKLAKRLKLSAPFLSDVELGRRPCPAHVLKSYQRL